MINTSSDIEIDENFTKSINLFLILFNLELKMIKKKRKKNYQIDILLVKIIIKIYFKDYISKMTVNIACLINNIYNK